MSFKSPNYTQAPNELFDALPLMGYAELKVTLAIVRLTFGWHVDAVLATDARIAEMTGLTEASVKTGAEEAQRRGFIKRTPGSGKTPTAWALCIDDPEKWEGVLTREGVATIPPATPPPSKRKMSTPLYSKENITYSDSKKKHDYYPLALALSEVCRMDFTANKSELFAEAKRLGADKSPDEVRARFGGGSWWYLSDWRGQKGQAPTPVDVRRSWGKWGTAGEEKAKQEGSGVYV